jgi:hypothetical protein
VHLAIILRIPPEYVHESRKWLDTKTECIIMQPSMKTVAYIYYFGADLH